MTHTSFTKTPIAWFIMSLGLLCFPILLGYLIYHIASPAIFYIYAHYILPYLLGSIPFGFVITAWAGLGDIRSQGSGNIGATNALRTGNKMVAFLTLFFDVIKGMAGYGALIYSSNDMLESTPLLALMPVLGHVFPIWLKFKGGKGVATALGVYAIMAPLLCFITVVFWGAIAKLFKISSLAALLAFALTAVLCLLDQFLSFNILPHASYSVMPVMSLIIILTHKDNIKRLLNKQEK